MNSIELEYLNKQLGPKDVLAFIRSLNGCAGCIHYYYKHDYAGNNHICCLKHETIRTDMPCENWATSITLARNSLLLNVYQFNITK